MANEPLLAGGFWLGLHQPGLCQHFPLAFVSANVIRNRHTGFRCSRWIMDSGAFTELSLHGRHRYSVSSYAALVRRWSCSRTLVAAVSQDYMCEPLILARTELSVADHQRLTVERYRELLEHSLAVPVIPVLQGYEPYEYVKHLRQYGSLLLDGMWVGVGSICKRNSSPESVYRILLAVHSVRPDLRLHGFGLKTTALADIRILRLLYSADSMAWSYAARRDGGDANGLTEAVAFYNRIEKIIEVANGEEGSKC